MPELGFVAHSEATVFGISTPGRTSVLAESYELGASCPHQSSSVGSGTKFTSLSELRLRQQKGRTCLGLRTSVHLC